MTTCLFVVLLVNGLGNWSLLEYVHKPITQVCDQTLYVKSDNTYTNHEDGDSTNDGDTDETGPTRTK